MLDFTLGEIIFSLILLMLLSFALIKTNRSARRVVISILVFFVAFVRIMDELAIQILKKVNNKLYSFEKNIKSYR